MRCLGLVIITTASLIHVAFPVRGDDEDGRDSLRANMVETPNSNVANFSFAALIDSLAEENRGQSKLNFVQSQRTNTSDNSDAGQTTMAITRPLASSALLNASSARLSGEYNLNVAVLSPLNCSTCTQNAQDALTGWSLWEKSVDNKVELPDGTAVSILSDVFPYEDGEGSLKSVAEQIDPNKYHLVIGTSTHFFKQVLEVMQEKQMLNIQCEGGDPAVWSKLAEEFPSQLYGFGIHSPFTEYPRPFFEKATDALKKGGVDTPTVAFVGKLEMHFAKALCAEAKKIAESLNLKILEHAESAVSETMNADILYGCTMNDDGMDLMRFIQKSGNRRPHAISISIAPAKPWFREEFGKAAALVTYPGQWHFTSQYTCDDETFCPKLIRSADEFNLLNTDHTSDGDASYMRASCTAAGVALERAMQSLTASIFDGEDSVSKVRDHLFEEFVSMNTTSFFGSIEFDKKTHMSNRPASIVQYMPMERCGDLVELDLGDTPLVLWDVNAHCAEQPEEKAKPSAAPTLCLSLTILASLALVNAFGT